MLGLFRVPAEISQLNRQSDVPFQFELFSLQLERSEFQFSTCYRGLCGDFLVLSGSFSQEVVFCTQLQVSHIVLTEDGQNFQMTKQLLTFLS